MPTMYKLVTQAWTTHNGMKWSLGKTNKAKGQGNEMCTNQVLHCYKTPEQAVFLNPMHANIKNPILLEIICSEIINTDQLKFACKEQTPIRLVNLPVLTIEDRVTIAIRLVKLFYKNKKWSIWANNWLSNVDRSSKAAVTAAAYAAYAAADAAYAAADAAYAAADAAYAAADAAYADAAAYAAAYAAAGAAYADAEKYDNFNTTLQNIINSVIKERS